MFSQNEEKAKIIRQKRIEDAAKRALQEVEQRKKIDSSSKKDERLPIEVNGRKGLEPTRFGDWEKGGIAYDF